MDFNVNFDREKVYYDLALRYAQTMLDHALHTGELENSDAALEIEALDYILYEFNSAMTYFSLDPSERQNPTNDP